MNLSCTSPFSPFATQVIRLNVQTSFLCAFRCSRTGHVTGDKWHSVIPDVSKDRSASSVRVKQGHRVTSQKTCILCINAVTASNVDPNFSHTFLYLFHYVYEINIEIYIYIYIYIYKSCIHRLAVPGNILGLNSINYFYILFTFPKH
jgi:hypothetical protein